MSIQTFTAARRRGSARPRSACPARSSARRTAHAPRASPARTRSPRPRPARTAGRSHVREAPAPPSPRRSRAARRARPQPGSALRGRTAARPRRTGLRSPSSRPAGLRRPAGAAGRCRDSRARTPVARSVDERLQARLAQGLRLALDVPLVPEREREQPPELARQVLPAGHMAVDQPLDGLGPEETLAAECLLAQRLAGERLELAAQPGRCRNREAAFLAADDPARDERRDRLPQQNLLA